MGITKRTLKNRQTVYDVVEYSGFTFNGNRDRTYITCSTLHAAKVEQAKIVAQRDAMRNRSGRITFQGYLDAYYLRTMDNLAASSRDTYRREIDKRLIPAFGNIDIRNIARPQIQHMVDRCATFDVAKKAIGVLKTILNQAKGDGLIVVNPACATYRMPPKGRKRDNGLVLASFYEMESIFSAIDESGDEAIEKLAVTGLLMGLRPEERYALDWADFNFQERTVSITHAYTAVSAREGSNDYKKPKTQFSARTIPLQDAAWRRLHRIYKSDGTIKVGYFLMGRQGGRLCPSSAQKHWKAFLKENPKLPPVTLENMRHSFATSYLAAGGKVETLSRLLGHADINTTYRRYVRPNIQNMVVDAAIVDKAISY